MEHQHTYKCLEDWFKVAVEKAGWMLIKHHEGDDDVLPRYMETLAHLKQALEAKAAEYRDVDYLGDKYNDLAIMVAKVTLLWKHVQEIMVVEKVVDTAAHSPVLSRLASQTKERLSSSRAATAAAAPVSPVRNGMSSPVRNGMLSPSAASGMTPGNTVGPRFF